jgi:hypothetical protein
MPQAFPAVSVLTRRNAVPLRRKHAAAVFSGRAARRQKQQTCSQQSDSQFVPHGLSSFPTRARVITKWHSSALPGQLKLTARHGLANHLLRHPKDSRRICQGQCRICPSDNLLR